MNRRYRPERFGLRWQAQRDTALASSSPGAPDLATAQALPTTKRRRRCALPAQSKGLRRFHSCLSIALVLLATALSTFGQLTREYDLKAAFLFNFTQFVEWPASAFATADEPFTIGVLGEDPFGGALDDVLRGEKVNGRRLLVRRYRNVDDIKSCQILFISKSESAKLGEIVDACKGRSVLTVGETDEIAANGGVIRFFTDKNRLRVRINVDAAKEAKLTISSKLLRAAEIVNSAGTR